MYFKFKIVVNEGIPSLLVGYFGGVYDTAYCLPKDTQIDLKELFIRLSNSKFRCHCVFYHDNYLVLVDCDDISFVENEIFKMV